MKISFGCDHRGLLLKSCIIEYLTNAGHEVIDEGTYDEMSVDYPVYGEKVGRRVASGECELGILACGTGYGISLAATAVDGIRAVCCSDVYTAELSRRHNNANVLSMGSRVVGEGLAVKLVEAFVNTGFEGGRHTRRVNMLDEIKLRNDKITGKELYLNALGRELRLLNQRCAQWTHPYEYAPNPGGTLKSSGCGIFSTCEAVEVLSGKRISPEELADFSCRVGGRGDDGTNRPMLLKGMVEAGLDKEYGFVYNLDGHLNDHALLWDCLCKGGVALCNIRPGHIVTLIDCRVVDGEKQILVMDCHSESADERVRESVREVLENSVIRYPVYNAQGVLTGVNCTHALFWVPLTMAKDFDLLHKR